MAKPACVASARWQPDAAPVVSVGGELALLAGPGGLPAAALSPEVLRVLVVEDDEEDFS